MQRRTRTWRMKLGLFVASLALSFALVEGILLIAWRNPYRKEGPDRLVTLRMQHAHTDHRFRRDGIHMEDPEGALRTDARSYILPSFQYPSPDYTIAFLGGSTTECCVVREEKRFPALVSTLLAERGLRVNTLNAGTSGNTLHDSFNVLLNHVIQDRPNMVVLMHACNDIGVLTEGGSYAPRAGQLAGWSDVLRMTLMRLSSYSSILGLARNVVRERLSYAPTAPHDLMARPVARVSDALDGTFERRLRAFVRTCHALEVKPVLMTQPLSSHFTELTPDWTDATVQARFNAITRRVGQEEDAQVIDLVRHLEEDVPDWDRHMHLFYDGMHVNDRGSEIYAAQITKELLPQIQSDTSAAFTTVDGEAADPVANKPTAASRR